jgi:nucleoside 2-deoxyribosyltransferase
MAAQQRKPVIYLIGSLRNPDVVTFANRLEEETGAEVFTSWFAAGPEADDKWKEHETARGRTYKQALRHHAAVHVFEFDKAHIERADAVLLVLPAGKSGHLELGWALGQGKPGFIFLDTPDRWDVMYQFATAVHDDEGELLMDLRRYGLMAP